MKNVRMGMGAAVLLAAIGLTGALPQEAQAAACGAAGSLVKPTYTFYSPATGKPIGSLEVYYSKKNGGTNTACMFHLGSTVGQPLPTKAYIARCTSYYGCPDTDDDDVDLGVFGSFAGPVRVSGTRNRCVSVQGLIQDPDTKQMIVMQVKGVGCAATPEPHYFVMGNDQRQSAQQNETARVSGGRR